MLVVEDNIEVGKFATQILEDLGYRTEWAANAEAALERLGSDGDGFDVVFSDVVMPGMGGIALAEELRRRLPTMPYCWPRATATCSRRTARTGSSCCTSPTRPTSSQGCYAVSSTATSAAVKSRRSSSGRIAIPFRWSAQIKKPPRVGRSL